MISSSAAYSKAWVPTRDRWSVPIDCATIRRYRHLGLTQEFREILVDMRHRSSKTKCWFCLTALESHHGRPMVRVRLHKNSASAQFWLPVGDLIVNHRNFPVVLRSIRPSINGAGHCLSGERSSIGRPLVSSHQCDEATIFREPRSSAITDSGYPFRRLAWVLHNFETVVVGKPDIENGVNMLFCRIDVGDQRVNRCRGIW